MQLQVRFFFSFFFNFFFKDGGGKNVCVTHAIYNSIARSDMLLARLVRYYFCAAATLSFVCRMFALSFPHHARFGEIFMVLFSFFFFFFHPSLEVSFGPCLPAISRSVHFTLLRVVLRCVISAGCMPSAKV